MAKAKKLKSGSWRVQVYDYTDNAGKRHYKSITASTKKEAELLAAQFMSTKNTVNRSTQDITVKEGIELYIKSKEKSLSPATIRGYRGCQRNNYSSINDVRISDLTSTAVQIWVGSLNESLSPKSVKNAYGLFTAMVDTLFPDKHFKVKLPQKERLSLYVPTDADVKKLIGYLKDNDKELYIACLLAAFGTLRRSEACALTADDVHGNVISINKAKVMDEHSNWIVKSTKNTSSTRDIVFPDYVIHELPKSGPFITVTPNIISRRFSQIFKVLDIPRFRYHDLRHYSASIMHAIGVPDVYIMERGGWSSDITLKNIYRGSMDDYQKHFTALTNDHFEKISHEISHENEKAQ